MISRSIQSGKLPLAVLAVLLVAFGSLHAASKRVVILHTNDNHDHVRLGYDGVGGLPRVSGYIRQVRDLEPNVLVLDAGDNAEKGDMVAARTHSLLTYELLRNIGYDGIAIGNHDFDPFGVPGIRRFEQVLGQEMLCLNLVKSDGTPVFSPSRIVVKGGLKIGLIGMIVPRHSEVGGLDFDESGRMLNREAKRLRPEVDLLVAVCHEGVGKCAQWSRAAPDVHVFVSGHTHVSLLQPSVVEETGALIVQAGCYARWVGHLNLDIDSDSGRIVRYDYRLVSMREGVAPVDEGMLARVLQREQALCPETREVVARNDSPITMLHTAWLAADALRRAAGTDLAFCHVGNIMRSGLPAGDVDVNALYLAGGSRGDETVRVALTGAQVEAYLKMLAAGEKWNQTTWSGFRQTRSRADHSGPIVTSLNPDKAYSVIMPELEWRTRFSKMARRGNSHDLSGIWTQGLPTTLASQVKLTEAMRLRARELTQAGRTLEAEADALASAGTDTPADDQWWWTGTTAEILDRHAETLGGH
ncbi:MAG: metallophosphoesterase [Opitutaceae bacterium]|nr:metallophosphoesterase [Opitutaceae bacterium]